VVQTLEKKDVQEIRANSKAHAMLKNPTVNLAIKTKKAGSASLYDAW